MDKEELGRFIYAKRKQKNMTQKELANILNVSVTSISKWERGINFPDIMLCEALCETLGITLAELFTQTDRPDEIHGADEKIEHYMKDVLAILSANNREEKKTKVRWIRLSFVFAFIILFLIICLCTTVYLNKDPVFTPVYTEVSTEINSEDIAQIVYNLYVNVQGKLDEQDIDGFCNSIITKWNEGAFESENPDIIHVYFYNSPKEYENKSFIAESVILHP